MTIDLDQEAIEQDTSGGRQGILGRLDPSKDRTSTKIEALCVPDFLESSRLLTLPVRQRRGAQQAPNGGPHAQVARLLAVHQHAVRHLARRSWKLF